MTALGKWLTIEEVTWEPARRKTRIWRVLGSDGTLLGLVSWYTTWRQYTFSVSGNDLGGTIITLNKTCLRDIAEFCEKQTAAHMQALTDRDDSARTAPYGG